MKILVNSPVQIYAVRLINGESFSFSVIFGSQEYDHEPLKSICLSSINPNAEEIDRLNSARLVFTKVVWAPALNK